MMRRRRMMMTIIMRFLQCCCCLSVATEAASAVEVDAHGRQRHHSQPQQPQQHPPQQQQQTRTVQVVVEEPSTTTTSSSSSSSSSSALSSSLKGLARYLDWGIPSPPNHARDGIHVADVIAGDLGVAQLLEDPRMKDVTPQDVIEVILDARDYVDNVVHVEKRYTKVRELCRNRVARCALFAVRGECEDNPDWMDARCAPVCHSCETLHAEARCPPDPNARHVWYPGDLHRMFQRIVTDPDIIARYQPRVWARPTLPSPSSPPHDDDDDDDDDDGHPTADDTPIDADHPVDGPWVVTLENFFNATEAQILIQHGANLGYERSADVGEENPDGSFEDDVNEGRTSENAWCEEACREDPVTQAIWERIEDVTGIHANYSESIQLLRYEPGQFYGVHHDYIHHEVDRLEGPRILTVFMYLNDVEEGGETRFDDLDLRIAPKLGRVLLWPSVTNENPLAMDPRTHHEALPVIRGIKYGANAWLHLRDVVGPSEYGC